MKEQGNAKKIVCIIVAIIIIIGAIICAKKGFNIEMMYKNRQEIMISNSTEIDISNDDINIISIPNTRIRDILKPYILPGVVTFAAILLYFIIMYHKIGLRKVLLKGIFTPIIAELLYYSIIAITRIPFGRISNSIAIGLYVVSIGILSIYFHKEKEMLPKNDKKEND